MIVRRVKDFLATAKIAFNRGDALISPIKFVLMGSWIASSDTTFTTVLISSAAYGVLAIGAGHFDRLKGIMKIEAAMNTREINPYFADLERSIDEMKNDVALIRSYLGKRSLRKA